MLTKFSCFLLLFTFIFLLISYLFELLLELWLHQQQQQQQGSFTSRSSSSSSAPHLSASTSSPLLSPLDFGVDQLKLILAFRGIYYLQQLSEKTAVAQPSNVQQQKEKLAELVATSGQINHDELLQLRLESTSAAETESGQSPAAAGRGSSSLKVFASAKLMEEEIDDNHIWLLYISSQNDEQVLPNVWSQLVRQFGKFDLRFARFDCKADLIYCHRRRWHSPRLVLVFPRSRDKRMVGKRIYNYPLESQTHSTDVILWLQATLSSQLSPIDDIDAMLDSGVHHHHQHPNDDNSNSKHSQLVNVVAIMGEQFAHSPPLSLSLLALRFRDRVTFGVHFAKSPASLARLHAQLGTRIAPHLPIYLVVHGGRPTVYNADHPGPLSYSAMDVYLRGLTLDESNDLYLVLFALANLYLGLNFFWTRCMTARRHLGLCTIRAVEVNLLLLSITAVLWPLVGGSLANCLAFVPQSLLLLTEQSFSLAYSTLWSSHFAFHFRAQLLAPYSTERFFAAFVISGAILVTLRRCTQLRLFGDRSYDDELIKSVFYWASVIGCFAGFLLFRKSRPTNRRRHLHLSNGDFHDRTEGQLGRNVGAVMLNGSGGGERPPLASTSGEEWPNSEVEEEGELEDLEELEEGIDLDSDLDRLLLESIFSGMAGNLWLQPELISTDYIHQLPVWQVVLAARDQAQDREEEDELSHTAVEEESSSSSSSSNSSTSSDVSDTEEPARRDSSLEASPSKQPLAVLPSSSKASCNLARNAPSQKTPTKQAEHAPSCCAKKPLNTKEAPQSSCCEMLAESCGGGSNSSSKESARASQQQISSQYLRAKLEENKRKIMRIRRKRGKRTAVSSAVAAAPSAASTEVHEQEKASDGLCLSRPDWMLDFNDCTICLEAYRNEQAIIGLACGHNYHRDCLTQWLVRGNHCCPICRWPSYRMKHPRQSRLAPAAVSAGHRC